MSNTSSIGMLCSKSAAVLVEGISRPSAVMNLANGFISSFKSDTKLFRGTPFQRKLPMPPFPH